MLVPTCLILVSHVPDLSFPRAGFEVPRPQAFAPSMVPTSNKRGRAQRGRNGGGYLRVNETGSTGRRNYIHHPGFNTFFDLGKTRGFILIIAAKRGSSTPRELETLDLDNMSWTPDEHFPTRRESSGARTRRMASQQQLDQGPEDQVCKCSQGEARINLANPKGLRIKTHVTG